MRKLILVVHLSLDGFVAASTGELTDFPQGKENLTFVNRMTDQADTAMFGSIPFEPLESYLPTAGNRPDATRRRFPRKKPTNTTLIRNDIPSIFN